MSSYIIWCLTSRGVRSARARAFNTCAREHASKDRRAREVREQGARAMHVRARDNTRAHAWRLRTRTRAQISSHKLSARPNKLTKSTFGARLARAPCSRACLFWPVSRAHVSNARAHAGAWFQMEMFHMFSIMTTYTFFRIYTTYTTYTTIENLSRSVG